MQTVGTSIFIAGASRGVGLEIAKWLVSHQYQVSALVRTAESATELEALGVDIALGDALDTSAVEQALSKGNKIQAVISTLGGIRNGQRSDYLGTKHFIDAAVKLEIPRFLLVSSIGSGESVVALPPQVLEALRPALIEKEKAEQDLIQSGLSYTIIRPGGLKSEPATGNGILTTDPRVAGAIHRADVADLVCRCLQSEQAKNQILSAVDRNQMYGPMSFQEFSLDS